MNLNKHSWGHNGRDQFYNLDLQLPVESVPIPTNIVSSNLAHSEVYLIQYYLIKFVSDLRQICGFL